MFTYPLIWFMLDTINILREVNMTLDPWWHWPSKLYFRNQICNNFVIYWWIWFIFDKTIQVWRWLLNDLQLSIFKNMKRSSAARACSGSCWKPTFMALACPCFSLLSVFIVNVIRLRIPGGTYSLKIALSHFFKKKKKERKTDA